MQQRALVGRLLRGLLGLAAVAAAAAIRGLMYRRFGANLPFMPFFAAVAFSAVYGGMPAAVAATVASIFASCFVLNPETLYPVWRPSHPANLALFAAVLIFIVMLCERMRRANVALMGAAIERARLAAVVESSGDAIISKTLDGVVRTWNAAAERIFGYPADEIVGRSIEVLIPPERPGEERAIVDKLQRGERVEHFETVRVRRDGTRIDVAITASPVRDEAGRVVAISKIARDVTGRRRAESQLRAARAASERALAQWRAAVGSMVEGMVVIDAGGEILEWNRAALDLHGFRDLEEVRMHISVLRNMFVIHTLDGAPLPLDQWPLSRALAGEAFHMMEVHVRRLDNGREWFISYSGTPVRDDAGAIQLALVTLHDVTERRRSEERLREGEERLRLGLEAGNTGTWDWDLSTGHVTWSDRIYAMHGLRPEEFGGTNVDFQRLIYPDDVQRVGEAIADSLRDRAPYQVEFRIRRPDGTIRWLSTTGRASYDAGGSPARMRGATSDVTERKLIEQQRDALLESERAARGEAERASRLKDEFLATVSHELRTPLNAILGYAQLLRLGPFDPAEVGEGLEVIERNARAQTQIIADLLDMSRIVAGKVQLDVQLVNLPSVVAASLETVRPAAEAKGVTVESSIDPRGGPITGDAGRLQQVIWNLLSNAIKFTPRGGLVRVGLARAGTDVELTVADSGAGIAPEFLPYVFERFRQADSSTTRRHGGLGLGLAIVKHIIELHGGTVRASSAGEGHGATFAASLPLTAVLAGGGWNGAPRGGAARPAFDATRVTLVRPEPTLLEGLRVLVVDDDIDALELVRRLLEESRATVSTADSVDQALLQMDIQLPDVLVSDIGMPGQDGYDFIRKVRARGAAEGGTIPAAALTAFARAEDRTRALRAGYQTHIAKPVEPAELAAAVANLAGRGAAHGRSAP